MQPNKHSTFLFFLLFFSSLHTFFAFLVHKEYYAIFTTQKVRLIVFQLPSIQFQIPRTSVTGFCLGTADMTYHTLNVYRYKCQHLHTHIS